MGLRLPHAEWWGDWEKGWKEINKITSHYTNYVSSVETVLFHLTKWLFFVIIKCIRQQQIKEGSDRLFMSHDNKLVTS